MVDKEEESQGIKWMEREIKKKKDEEKREKA